MATFDVSRQKKEIKGHSIELDELISRLNTDKDTGLTNDEAARRLEEYGVNEIPKPQQSFWQVYLAPLLNTLIVVYLAMTTVICLLALIYLFINPNDTSIWWTALQWLIIVAINFGIAIVQQARAQKKIEALQKLAAPEARVIREDKESEIDTIYLVPGDVVKIAQGDKIPADCRILRSSSLRVNEASLTGESVPSTKVEDGDHTFPEDTPIGSRKNMVYNGTFVTMGSGICIAVNTGGNTEFGMISRELEELNTGDIPIRAKVNVIGNYLTFGMLIVFSLLLIYQATLILNNIKFGLYRTELELLGDVIFQISNMIIKAMSVVPINIPLLTTIVLLTGVLAMAKRNVIIRNLAAIESLGRISILCSDKTGTITTGQMTIQRLWDASEDKFYEITGIGYAPEGSIIPLAKSKTEPKKPASEKLDPVIIDPNSSLGFLIIGGMLNNDSEIVSEKVGDILVYSGTGSPTESALLALFNKTGLSKDNILREFRLVREYPFDSSFKRMSKVFKVDEKEQHLVFCKGATEVVLERCQNLGYAAHARPLKPRDRKKILGHMEELAAKGFRVLSLTYKEVAELPAKNDEERDLIEEGLSYLGFVSILDPPRERVNDSVVETISAGITPIMITGDSSTTAQAIATEIGMLSRPHHQIHEGHEADDLNETDFFDTRVFARVAPKDKQIIVERYQENTRVVAMTGDGVNDALALSMSDAGIAMGISGTEVSKQAADLVIADDSFNSIVTGIREGRALFQRIRVIIFFYICVNLAEAAAYIGSTFISGFILNFELMDTLQRAYIFGIAHTFPPLALIFDKIPRDIMDRDPIDSAGIFNKKLAATMLITSITLATSIYFFYFTTFFGWIPVNAINMSGFVPLFQTDPEWIVTPTIRKLAPMTWEHAKARTFMHTILYLTIPLIVLSIRRVDKSLFNAIREDSWWPTYVFVFAIIPFHMFLMYFPVIQEILSTLSFYLDIIALDLVDWIICLIGALIPVIVLETAKWLIRASGKYY
ncbi:MAG: cation-translocating P-type ATPase [Candidatus Thorarchaeota archaeon]